MNHKKRSRRFGWGAVVIAAVALMVWLEPPLALFAQTYQQRNLPSLPLPDRPPPRDSAEANAQDVDDLSQLPRNDRSLSDAARAMFARDLVDLRAAAGALSPAQFEMAVSRLVALAGNGHTTVGVAQRTRRFNRVPLRFAWFADGLFVVRAAGPAVDLLGARVASIDGHSPEEAFTAIRAFISGTAEHARAESPRLFESPALLQTIWPDTDGARLMLEFETASGAVKRAVDATMPTLDRFGDRPALIVAPGAYAEVGWTSLLPDDSRLPMSLQEPERSVFFRDQADGLYLRINAVADDEHGPLAEQLALVMASRPPLGWRWILVDLRFDPGGDDVKAAAFTRALPELLRNDGNLWILTANPTFSAAIAIAARARYFVGSRAHIVGERVGDHAPFWAQGGTPLVLRNSGITVQRANFMHDWVHGCTDIRRCFPLNLIYGVAAGDLSPETDIGWKFSDYAAGRDTLLDWVLQRASPH